MRHREAVVRIFQIASLLVGLPSLAGCVYLGWESARMHLDPPARAAGKSGNELIDLLVGGARLFGKFFELFAGAAKWAFTVLAILLFIVALFAGALFLTSRGIAAGRSWARSLGILLALAPLLMSLSFAMTVRTAGPVLIAGAVAAVSFYVVWALSMRFA